MALLPLLVVLAMQDRRPAMRMGPQEAEKPCIFFSWTPGMTVHPVYGEFNVAIWKSGKIVWRDPQIVWSRVGREWKLNKGRYFEGTIPPQALEATLGRIRDSGIDNAKLWNAIPLDSSFYSIVLRDGKTILMQRVWEPDSKHGLLQGESPATLQAWKLIRNEARALIPKTGKPIERPSDKGWDR